MVKHCIFCKSSSIVKNGSRKRKIRTKQSFLCMSCGRQFVEPDGFERMRHNPRIVLRAIHSLSIITTTLRGIMEKSKTGLK